MARNRRTADQDAHIVVTDAAGAVKILIRSGPNNVVIAPTTGQTQVVTVGDTAERADQRTPQVIWTDQQGGMGQFAYTETEGLESFTTTGCDTRYPGAIVLPLAQTANGTLPVVPTLPSIVEAIPDSVNDALIWQHNFVGSGSASHPAYRHVAGGTTIAALTTGAGVAIDYTTSLTRYNNRYFFTMSRATDQIAHSNDGGTTWTAVNYGGNILGSCVHDNKFYLWDNTAQCLKWTLDPTVTTGYLASAGLIPMQPREMVYQIFEWRDAAGRAVIYVLTSQRLFWYDEDADIFHLFYDFGEVVRREARPRAHAWKRDGSLYLTFFNATYADTTDTTVYFTGTTNIGSPNKRGGAPASDLTTLTLAAGGLNWLYFFGIRRAGGGGRSGVFAYNDQGGWHPFVSPDGGGGDLLGGGYGGGTIWYVTTTGALYSVAVPDTLDHPLFATGRAYRTGATYYHEYAYTDGGTPNMPKNARWVAVQNLNHTAAGKTPGLATGCEIDVAYMRDTDNAWTTLATLTSASTFPAIVPFPNTFGTFKQIKLRLGLRSSNASNTPTVTSVALAYLRQEVRREAVTVVADLADDERDFYAGQDRAQLWQRIKGWAQPGQIVALAFAGGDDGSPPATASSYSACTVEFSEYQDSQSGPGQVTLQFTDVSAPASG